MDTMSPTRRSLNTKKIFIIKNTSNLYLIHIIFFIQFILIDSLTITQEKSVSLNSENINPSNTSEEDTGRKLGCPFEKKDLCLVFALSKIANVQVANPAIETERRNFRGKSIGNLMWNTKPHVDEAEDMIATEKRPEERTEVQKVHSRKFPSQGSSTVHCRVIRDIYIPEVKQKMPAYACKYGNRIFVLSSERFLEDRRSSLEIQIDENTFQNTRFATKVTRTSDFNIIPALLVLGAGESNYKIRAPESNIK